MLKICFATIDVVRMWSLTIELGQGQDIVLGD
jgi:hypothetical protein